MVTARVCTCGRTIRGMGRRCAICQADYHASRSNTPAKAPRRGVRAQDDRNPEHLAWIRTLPCAVRGCPGISQAAHVRMNTGGGMGLKPPDCWTVPLCGGPHGHHAEQHQRGHSEFDKEHNLNLRMLAETLAARSPYLDADK